MFTPIAFARNRLRKFSRGYSLQICFKYIDHLLCVIWINRKLNQITLRSPQLKFALQFYCADLLKQRQLPKNITMNCSKFTRHMRSNNRHGEFIDMACPSYGLFMLVPGLLKHTLPRFNTSVRYEISKNTCEWSEVENIFY